MGDSQTGTDEETSPPVHPSLPPHYNTCQTRHIGSMGLARETQRSYSCVFLVHCGRRKDQKLKTATLQFARFRRHDLRTADRAAGIVFSHLSGGPGGVWFVSVQNKGCLDTVDVVSDELVFSAPRLAATQESSACSPGDLLVNRRDYHPHVRNSAVPPPACASHNICWDPARWRK
ncbi:hypothetical protein Bbelb_335660 [Branchiostoma belcheri]|nr:hypothetical protein Bbelb_335660 [Branchiostoma belcheri]